jgi:DNA primase
MYERDRLLAGIDLVQLADELVGPRVGNQRSGSWRCPSPEHTQTGRTPPVSVFCTRRGEQRWRCHGCGAGGTAIDLVMLAMNRDVRGAMDVLAARAAGDVVVSPPRPIPRPPDPRRLVELGAFVEVCAERLWLPEGRVVRRWLMNERGLPRDVLEHNKVGADLGSYAQRRPEGLPRGGPAAVFPAVHDDRVMYAQLRRLRPRDDQPKFLNPAASLATNPRTARYRPVVPVAQGVIVVTEGPIVALSAAAAGFRAVAVLGAAASDELVARRLAALPGRLAIAFDSDEAGQLGADRLGRLLSQLGRPPTSIELPGHVNDLNEWHCLSGDRWPGVLAAAAGADIRRPQEPPLSIA